MTGDPLVRFVARIEQALAIADTGVADGALRSQVKPLLGRALLAGRGRYPGVATFYLVQALGEVLSWRECPSPALREALMDLTVSARALTRWTGRRIPCDNEDAVRTLGRVAPLPPLPDLEDLRVAAVEEALRHLGEDVFAEPVPDSLINLVCSPTDLDPP